MTRRHPIRVGYEYRPGLITYWSSRTFDHLGHASRWARRLNRRSRRTRMPGRWVVRA